AGGADPFGLGAPWAADFAPLSANKYDVKTSTALTLRAKGDGVANDAPAIQAAIDLATKKGGIVYLPAGTYYIGGNGSAVIGLILRPNVVLQGHSSADTKIVYGPRGSVGSSYYFIAVYTNPATKLAGIADLSLQNTDTTSLNISPLAMGDPNDSENFLQRVNWDLGSGKSLVMGGERIAIENSTIRQAANSQYPRSDGGTGIGPLMLCPITNIYFSNNTVSWASGNICLNHMTNGIIENNHFTRIASDQIVAGPAQTSWPYVGKPIAVGDVVQRTPGRVISADFGTNSVFQNNIFDTSGGVIKYNWNDGETILSEAGSYLPQEDSGTVTAKKDAYNVMGQSANSQPWNYDPTVPYVLALVTGPGAGQWRNITGFSNNTFTLDKPLDLYAEVGDHFIIAHPGYLNVIIRNNTMSGNPFGVAMFDGTFINVSVTGNTMTDNGGVYLSPSQNTRSSYKTFSTYRNIEINNNIIKNKSGYYPAYININFRLVDQTTFFGRSLDTVEVRGNQLTARPGTNLSIFPFSEGYGNLVWYQTGMNTYVEQNKTPIVGTMLQGNFCTNCPVNYKLTGGDLNTVIWNGALINTGGYQSTFSTDLRIDNNTNVTSVGTIIGYD
ncbi:glycosyl hydrolase family 28-related protein, partial [Methylocapsa palsarum]